MSSIEQGYLHSIEIKKVPVTRDGKEEERLLAAMRVNIDRSRYKGEENGEPVYDDSKSFWVNAELWGHRVKHLEGMLEKGARVMLVGRYDDNKWVDEGGNNRSALKMVCDDVAIMPRSVESITFKPSKSADDSGDA